MTRLGAYLGASPKDVLQFEAWLGRDVDYLQIQTGRANWWDYENSISWSAAQLVQLNKPIYWTIPMFANGGKLADAAAGAYTDHWVEAAKTILATRPNDSQIAVRFGEEFNGNWMPWAAKGNEQTFIQAYRGMVDAFRSVSDKFVFDWNVGLGNHGMDPAKAYPGDAYVNTISADTYYDTAWDPKDPSAAFDYMIKRDYGLNWLDSFASAHGKPMAFPEWGVMSDNAGPYIAKFAAWMESHNVAYQSYWNSDADFAGKLSTGTKPNAGAAYINAFNSEATILKSIDEKSSSIVKKQIVLSYPVASSTEIDQVTTVHRFYDTHTGDHFYTTSTAEKAQIQQTLPWFTYEGTPWATPVKGAGTLDVFRFFDTHTDTHFFTTSASERDQIINTAPSYKYEGVAFEAYADTGAPGTVTLERFFNTQTGQHHFAGNAEEAAGINHGAAGPGWVDEGKGFTVHVAADTMLFA